MMEKRKQKAIEDAEEQYKKDLELAKKEIEEQKKRDKEKEKREEDKRKKQKAKDAYQVLNPSLRQGLSNGLMSLFSKDFREQRRAEKEAAKQDLRDEGYSDSDIRKGRITGVLDSLTHALGTFTKQLDSAITTTGNLQSQIDTRLYGSNLETKGGSIWRKISSDITSVASVSPIVKMNDIVNNLKTMVDSGIVYNVEQRAFLATIKDKIATTFDANDASLKKLIRIQQQDTTAGRLGMEAALNSFLNNMYQTTEYLKDLATQVRGDLFEAEALSDAKTGTELEYTVQKWLGSMYSVGANNVQNISKALGQILSGDVNGITSGGAGNLLIMAANRAGVSVSDMLSSGLNSDQTSNLLGEVVNYLGDIYDQAKNSRVVQQQLAQLYGLTASDLKAIAGLAQDQKAKKAISNQLSYDGMVNNLMNMANSITKRMSTGEMMDNVWENFKYSLGASIGANPVTYAIYKAGGLLDDVVGGIALPDIKFMGTGVNLQTTVADLMRVAALSGGVMTGIGSMLSGLGSGGNGASMLKKLNIGANLTTVQRGSGNLGIGERGASTSSSGYVGNASGSDVKNKVMSDASEEQENTLATVKEENTEVTIEDVNENVVLIYKLLEDVTTGALTFKVEDQGSTTSNWIRDTLH